MSTSERTSPAGEFPQRSRPGDDLIGFITQNGGQNKIDAFLQRGLDYSASVAADTGEIRATATIELTNGLPDVTLPGAIVGSNDQGLPPGTNRLTVVVYSPHRLVSATVDGSEEGFQTVLEFGLFSFSRVIDIAPGQTVVVELELEGEIDIAGGYRLLVPAQPSVLADHLEVSVGSIQESLDTSADQIFE